MQINEDGSVTLDFNATLEAAREFHKKYTRYNRSYLWYKQWAEKYKDETEPSKKKWSERYFKRADSYKERTRQYEKWETLYQLLLKNKRLRKSDSNDVEGCNNKLQDSKNDD